MCLVTFAWMSHPDYRLIAAANRDEFHARPTAPLGWWAEDPRVLAGRDLQASGTWMGTACGGRFAMLTNFRDLEKPAPAAPSRGGVVAGYLRGSDSAEDFTRALQATKMAFAGFSLIVGSQDALYFYSNRDGRPARPLEPGVYGLSNHQLDAPWPKLVRTRERLRHLIESGEPDAASLMDILSDRQTADEASMPDTGLPADWERALSAPFVQTDQYGTRSSSILLLGMDGHTVMHERRFDSSGVETGRTRIAFDSGTGQLHQQGSGLTRHSPASDLADDLSPE